MRDWGLGTRLSWVNNDFRETSRLRNDVTRIITHSRLHLQQKVIWILVGWKVDYFLFNAQHDLYEYHYFGGLESYLVKYCIPSKVHEKSPPIVVALQWNANQEIFIYLYIRKGHDSRVEICLLITSLTDNVSLHSGVIYRLHLKELLHLPTRRKNTRRKNITKNNTKHTNALDWP